MSDRWRDKYDGWKLASGNTVHASEDDFEWVPCAGCNGHRSALCGDCEAAAREAWQDKLDAQAEDAAIEKAEREREDARRRRLCFRGLPIGLWRKWGKP